LAKYNLTEKVKINDINFNSGYPQQWYYYFFSTLYYIPFTAVMCSSYFYPLFTAHFPQNCNHSFPESSGLKWTKFGTILEKIGQSTGFTSLV